MSAAAFKGVQMETTGLLNRLKRLLRRLGIGERRGVAVPAAPRPRVSLVTGPELWKSEAEQLEAELYWRALRWRRVRAA